MQYYKTNGKYVLRKIAGESVLVPVGAGVADFTGFITLNDTAAVLWKTLQNGADTDTLVNALLSEYDVTKEQAEKDVALVVKMLASKGMIDCE